MGRQRTNILDSFDTLVKLRKSVKMAIADLDPLEFEDVMSSVNAFATAEAIRVAGIKANEEN
jgi:hypothetical protein